MGGGHHEPYKIPDYTVYNNWRMYPELAAYENKLALHGLKDPWIRNYAHLYEYRNQASGWQPHWRVWRILRVGLLPGLAIAAAAVTIDKFFILPYIDSKHDHGHESHH